ncbi:MAG: hypothetical protein ACK6D4_02265, partial [Planctomyces sp.]
AQWEVRSAIAMNGWQGGLRLAGAAVRVAAAAAAVRRPRLSRLCRSGSCARNDSREVLWEAAPRPMRLPISSVAKAPPRPLSARPSA